MSNKTTPLSPALYQYLVERRSERDPVLEKLRQATAALGPASNMQISPEQGALMTLLCRALGAREVIEIGTFTGYSTLCLARGLPEGGRVLTCDIDPETTRIAQAHWDLAGAGVADRIELRLGPALETLRALPREPRFHLGFIDADKPNYRGYYEEVLPRLLPNGLLLIDNVLWSGHVVDPARDDDNTRAIRELNDLLPQDPRVECVMLPISDGLTIARKR